MDAGKLFVSFWLRANTFACVCWIFIIDRGLFNLLLNYLINHPIHLFRQNDSFIARENIWSEWPFRTCTLDLRADAGRNRRIGDQGAVTSHTDRLREGILKLLQKLLNPPQFLKMVSHVKVMSRKIKHPP